MSHRRTPEQEAQRRRENTRRAADYQRALSRLRDLHRAEFEQIYTEERTRQQQPTNHVSAAR